MQKTGFLHLATLAVSPKLQKKGIGRESIKWEFAVAEEGENPVRIEASVTGRALYRKLGFAALERQKQRMILKKSPCSGHHQNVPEDGNVKRKLRPD